MKAFDGYKAEQTNFSREKLPKGCYVAKIIGAKEEENNKGGSCLKIQVEIAEGEYAGFYKRDYDSQSNSQFEKKYRGVYRMNIPNGNDNQERQDKSRRIFNSAMWCIEKSNPGYHWNWEENTLKGKLVGINVRNASYNGAQYTEIGGLDPVDDVRSGKAKPMKDRAPRGESEGQQATGSTAVQAPATSTFTVVQPTLEDEIPF